MLPGRILSHPRRSRRSAGLPEVGAADLARRPGLPPGSVPTPGWRRDRPRHRPRSGSWATGHRRDGHGEQLIATATEEVRPGPDGPGMDWEVPGHDGEAISNSKKSDFFLTGYQYFRL